MNKNYYCYYYLPEMLCFFRNCKRKRSIIIDIGYGANIIRVGR
jgi:hypothetical protein